MPRTRVPAYFTLSPTPQNPTPFPYSQATPLNRAFCKLSWRCPACDARTANLILTKTPNFIDAHLPPFTLAMVCARCEAAVPVYLSSIPSSPRGQRQ